MSAPSVVEVLDDAGCGVRAEFYFVNDRFHHTLFRVKAGALISSLESVEGSPTDDFPPSPPFSELHQQDETLFLTGATVTGHWSMSVQPIDRVLLFDIACRVKQHPTWLGSTYQPAETNEHHDILNIELLPDADCQLQLDENSQLALGCSTPSEVKAPVTYRWRYRVGIKK